MALPHELERLVMMASDGRWGEIMAQIPAGDSFSSEVWSELLVRLAFYGKTCWISALLGNGANPGHRSETGDTCLSECLSGSSRKRATFQTFLQLLAAGADSNEITRGGNRILHLAISENRPEFAVALLMNGADPRLPAPDPDRPDAFRVARSCHQAWAVDILERWRIENPELASEAVPDPWGVAPARRLT